MTARDLARRTRLRLRPARRWTRRKRRRLLALVRRRLLELRLHRSSASILGEAPVVVSLTSYGERIDSVAATIESIARGTVRPSRLILWLDEVPRVDDPPPALARLVRRGLEILLTPDLGPHKKYYPYVASVPEHRVPLVTADDDVLYPRTWLAELMASYERSPGQVSAHRVKVVRLEGEGFAPYATWRRCLTTRPSHAHFATGVSGVLYPPPLLDALRERGLAFREACPRADDIWLHHTALREGFPVGQVGPRPRHYLTLPGTQGVGLVVDNLDGGGNDRQLAAVYAPGDIEVIRGALVSSS